MNAKDKIKNFLNELSSKYKDSFEKFRYEYDLSLETHLIEVSPIDLYNNASYSEEELKFCIDFTDEFCEDMLFISPENIIKIINPEFEVCNNKGEMDKMFSLSEGDYELAAPKYVFKFSLDDINNQGFVNECNHKECVGNNFALAA